MAAKFFRLLALFTLDQFIWLKSQNKPITEVLRDLVTAEMNKPRSTDNVELLPQDITP